MVKKMKVDVGKSLGYQANGRISPADKKELAKLTVKKFVCVNCGYEDDSEKSEFGEEKICPKCGKTMIQNI